MKGEFRKDHKTKFIGGSVPEKMEKLENGHKRVFWTDP